MDPEALLPMEAGHPMIGVGLGKATLSVPPYLGAPEPTEDEGPDVVLTDAPVVAVTLVLEHAAVTRTKASMTIKQRHRDLFIANPLLIP
jgi:hypothetical protein